MTIPNGNQAVMPYLLLHGAATFITFTKAVFDATASEPVMTPGKDRIMHAQVMISGSTIMCCDASDQWPAQPANLFVYVDNADTSYQKALDAGGISVMELSDQDYGRTCGVKDPTGNTWWITSMQQ